MKYIKQNLVSQAQRMLEKN